MHGILVAIVFAFWSQMGNMYGKQPDARAVADAIASAVEVEETPATGESHALDAALLAFYAAKESGVSLHPIAWSWDAKAGLSVGVWQLRRELVTGRPLTAQAAMWLHAVRVAGLVGADSSATRAEMRLRRTRELLAAALETMPAIQ